MLQLIFVDSAEHRLAPEDPRPTPAADGGGPRPCHPTHAATRPPDGIDTKWTVSVTGVTAPVLWINIESSCRRVSLQSSRMQNLLIELPSNMNNIATRLPPPPLVTIYIEGRKLILEVNGSHCCKVSTISRCLRMEGCLHDHLRMEGCLNVSHDFIVGAEG